MICTEYMGTLVITPKSPSLPLLLLKRGTGWGFKEEKDQAKDWSLLTEEGIERGVGPERKSLDV